MPAFDHVIITRFSVRFVADQPPADEDWLLYRWLFFRDAAASSLARQTARDFVWLVFFDARTPDWLRHEVAELAPGLFIPVWLEELWSHDAIRRAVITVTGKPFLITTRLDSDDGVARTEIKEVRTELGEFESRSGKTLATALRESSVNSSRS